MIPHLQFVENNFLSVFMFTFFSCHIHLIWGDLNRSECGYARTFPSKSVQNIPLAYRILLMYNFHFITYLFFFFLNVRLQNESKRISHCLWLLWFYRISCYKWKLNIFFILNHTIMIPTCIFDLYIIYRYFKGHFEEWFCLGCRLLSMKVIILTKCQSCIHYLPLR